MANITYVTGCDSRYFLMTGILLQAFTNHCPGRTLWVCDFGLEPSQKEVLSSCGILLPRPAFLKEHQHPWVYKSSLINYLRPLNPAIVVWLDSDCFPTGPFAEQVETLVSTWQKKQDCIAICQGKVGKTWERASPKNNIAHFGMDPSLPYYNSGVWVLRSQRVLDEWASAITTAPESGMFEQDTFNYLLHKHAVPIITLENNRWNATHDELNQLSIAPDGTILNSDNQQVLIIHITGVFTPLKVIVGQLSGIIRALKKSELKELQVRLLRDWVTSIHLI